MNLTVKSAQGETKQDLKDQNNNQNSAIVQMQFSLPSVNSVQTREIWEYNNKMCELKAI